MFFSFYCIVLSINEQVTKTLPRALSSFQTAVSKPAASASLRTCKFKSSLPTPDLLNDGAQQPVFLQVL